MTPKRIAIRTIYIYMWCILVLSVYIYIFINDIVIYIYVHIEGMMDPKWHPSGHAPLAGFPSGDTWLPMPGPCGLWSSYCGLLPEPTRRPGNMIGGNSSSRVRHQVPPVVCFAILPLRNKKSDCWEPCPAQDVALWSKLVYAHKASPKSL